MKKSALKKAGVALLAALCACSLTAGVLPAAAQESPAARAADGMRLLMPSSYEQYYDLNSPSDIDTTDDYLAIADGARLVLYYRDGGTQFYTLDMAGAVSQLQLVEADGSTWLYFLTSEGANSPLRYLKCTPDGFDGEPIYIYEEEDEEGKGEEGGSEQPGEGGSGQGGSGQGGSGQGGPQQGGSEQPGEGGSEQPGTGEEGEGEDEDREPIEIIPTQDPYETGIETCASYVVNVSANGTTLYYAPSSNVIMRAPMTGAEVDLDAQETIQNASNFIVPVFASAGGVAYYTWNTEIRSALTDTAVWNTTQAVSSFIVAGEECYYVSATNNMLYRAAPAGEAVPSAPYEGADGETVSGIRSVHYDGEMLYVVSSDTVRGYDLAEGRYNGYEISRYSDSDARLGADAQDISTYDDKTVIADNGNGRVIIYDAAAKTYTPFTPASRPLLVCAGADVFAVADEYDVYIYSYEGTLLHRQAIGGEIFDLAYSFGNFYIVDNTSVRKHSILRDEAGNYSLQAAAVSDTETFLSVATDIGGSVYTLSSTGSVRRFDADGYLSGSGEILCSMTGATQIVADYAGNVFGISGSTVTKFNPENGNSSTLSASLDGLVSGADTRPVAFSFGFRTDEVYFLADGFVAVTQNLGVNALSTIPATGLYDTIYTASADDGFASGRLVRVQKGAVSVQLDLTSLQGKDTLDCSVYEREEEERVGVLLAQTSAGSVVMFYHETVDDTGVNITRRYETCLVLGRGGCETIADSEALHEARDDAGQPYNVGYTTNAVGLYKYPLMSATNASGSNYTFCMITQLEKSTEVYILSALYLDGEDALDCSGYCFVRTQDLSGNVRYGFIPMQYILPYLTDSAEQEPFTIGHIRGDTAWTLTAVDGSTYTTKDGDLVHIYGDADENGMLVISYSGEDGRIYRGMINQNMIYEANQAVVYALIFVPIVTAVVLLSLCYLIYRKQPTLS